MMNVFRVIKGQVYKTTDQQKEIKGRNKYATDDVEKEMK